MNKQLECIRKFQEIENFERTVIIQGSFDKTLLENKIQKFKGSSVQGVFKPYGLWYAIGKSWLNFLVEELMDESWFKDNVLILEDIDLSKMLLIRTDDEFIKFEERFLRRELGQQSFQIDWKQVSNYYAGIEIAPYLYSQRYKTWYYTWDVASGCIWDPSIISKIREIK